MFIQNKYKKKKYVMPTTAQEDERLADLKMAIQNRDILGLLQVYGEGVSFTEPLPDMVCNYSSGDYFQTTYVHTFAVVLLPSNDN